MPARSHLVEMLGSVDLRLVASGHVHQRRGFTFRHTTHVRAPGQLDVDLDSLFGGS